MPAERRSMETAGRGIVVVDPPRDDRVPVRSPPAAVVVAAGQAARYPSSLCWPTSRENHRRRRNSQLKPAVLKPVYTLQPVVKPVGQQVVSCKRGFT